MEEHQDGLHVVLRVRHLDELLQWVLGWGAGVIVLEPESFRNRIREEAKKMLKHY
jgi:predicted DNA-binding transcriptional regulator YafY